MRAQSCSFYGPSVLAACALWHCQHPHFVAKPNLTHPHLSKVGVKADKNLDPVC